MGYSEAAFRQATMLYEEACPADEFEDLCNAVAAKVTIYQEMALLISRASNTKKIGILVVTCGLRRVWEIVLSKAGLSRMATVIGNGRVSDEYFVSPQTKAEIVSHLHHKAGVCVWAFGDSPIDIPMMREADRAFVVVGDQQSRSKSMDAAVEKVLNCSQPRL